MKRAPSRDDLVLLLKKFMLLVTGVAVTHFGVALSMIPDIGIGAYDAFGLTVSYISGVDVSIIYAAMSGSSSWGRSSSSGRISVSRNFSN